MSDILSVRATIIVSGARYIVRRGSTVQVLVLCISYAPSPVHPRPSTHMLHFNRGCFTIYIISSGAVYMLRGSCCLFGHDSGEDVFYTSAFGLIECGRRSLIHRWIRKISTVAFPNVHSDPDHHGYFRFALEAPPNTCVDNQR